MCIKPSERKRETVDRMSDLRNMILSEIYLCQIYILSEFLKILIQVEYEELS